MAVLASWVTFGYVLEDEKDHGWVIAVNWVLVVALLAWGYTRRPKHS
ncbi:hypothetical protein [Aeromicrobium sp.]